MPVTPDNIADVFTYHAPEGDQLQRYANIRRAAHDFAAEILNSVPVCGDQQAAIRHVRESMMTANAAIAMRGQV